MTQHTVKHPFPLEVAESRRYVVYVAEWTRYGGSAMARAVFSRRELAVAWARASAQGAIDWTIWHPDDNYPFDKQRDDETKHPTFIATWADGSVKCWKTEVADHI